jgi:hypothetical protein
MTLFTRAVAAVVPMAMATAASGAARAPRGTLPTI